ncbi:type I-C CRISPR-associated protein Cas8c/Csd1 [Candidatus Endomicrobiellum trichonymphae]|uniref:type I-C CRISPR-associated protein Cas8c/Csd1 n=1 Tax=Endomicrobium trichonymphae TaxID=1408204 RepID=UPI000864D32C|nr:type I-C CRISPR-associated protein Cas8c/Csd1 [Candidatus Endomicrobium trichonymphae]BAV58775.1 CRISPR-associated protein Csd1 [Candidatus Endomicrobium trichonymphae]
MSWFQRLYETYGNCVAAQGEFEIAPVAHTNKVCNIEITLNEKAEFIKAEFIKAEFIEAITPIPTTDDNNCLWPLAVDIKTYQKEKDKQGKELKVTYKKLLKEWSDTADIKIQIVNKYIQKNTLIQDLEKKGILWLSEDGKFIEKPKKDITDKYKIFQYVKKQKDAFIRWIVDTGEGLNRNTWEDEAIIESWINFRKQKENKKYKSEIEKTYRKIDKENNIVSRLTDDKICYISGEITDCITTNHPFANGTSKLIAVGDDLVFKGIFEEYYEALSVSFDVSQKAHNTLKWLISKEREQAYRNYPQIIVAFTINGKNGNVGLIFGEDFVKSAKGYRIDFEKFEEDEKIVKTSLQSRKHKIDFEKFEEDEKIVLLEMNAASPGRACITYYKELLGSQYLKNIKNWHKKYCWQFLKRKNKNSQKKEYQYFCGTPSINTIANSYFYKKDKYSAEKSEQNIKRKLIRDLMPSVLENKNIPEYIEKHFIEKASNPVVLNNIQWKTILSIACSIYKGNHLYYDENKKEEDCLMSVDENCKDRNYLYGRLLAVIDDAEKSALLKQNKENSNAKETIRSTNAQRLMRQFSIKPFETWKFLYEKFNDAYKKRLSGDWIDKRIADIKDKFTSIEEFENNLKLTGLYLLGYFHQLKTIENERGAAIQNKNKKEKEFSNDTAK